MQLLNTLLPITALLSTALGQVHNTTREFYLKTVVQSGQTNKASFNNRYLTTYHTGAGLSDATFTASGSRQYAVKGFLNATGTKVSGKAYSNMVFDFGNPFPWGLETTEQVTYSAWEPVQINVGTGYDGFYIDANGLQWSTQLASNSGPNEFGGWLACNWWHLQPQLFWYFKDYPNFSVPSNCAIVKLQPEYI